MATVLPFRAILYNSEYVGDLDQVITQPLGTIAPEELERLQRISPYNIVRLEFGAGSAGDDESDNRYTRAAKTLNQWLAAKVLRTEAQKGIYFYEQEFEHGQKSYTRRGIIAALQVEPYSTKTVMPHERTMFGPHRDHGLMLSHLRANIGPIFTLFSDSDRIVDGLAATAKKNPCLINFTDQNGLTHHLRPIFDATIQAEFSAYMASRSLLIADGHHRYESSLAYGSRQGKNRPGAGLIMAAIFDINDPGLLMLPTHRLVYGLSAVQKKNLMAQVKSEFKIVERGKAGALDREGYLAELEAACRECCALGLVTGDRAHLLLPERDVESGTLPVAMLHERILKPVLHHSAGGRANSNSVIYSYDFHAVCEAVIKGTADAAFIIDAIAIEEVYRRACLGQVMPQKTTFFYPKLPNGLIIYHMDHSF